MAGLGHEWVSLKCTSDRFDIDCGRVRCHCTTADFVAATDADVVVVVPAAYRHASPMIAHAAVPAGGGVEIEIRRASVRCARSYRFAYVDGRHYGVMAVSAPFVFDHRGGRPCDCDSYADGADDDDDDSRGGKTVIAQAAVAAIRGISAFVSTLMDTRFSAPRCPECNVPANHEQVLKYLETSTDRLHCFASDVDRECSKQTERLNKCHSLLKHHQIKIKILNAEIEDGLRFTSGLISSLLKNHKASFWTGKETIFLKTEKTREIKMSANQCFMHAIIDSQNRMIDNLTATHKEVLIMINTMQFFV